MKITKPEQESEQAKMELAETQKQLQELENKELRKPSCKESSERRWMQLS